jgi:hypothetical protein
MKGNEAQREAKPEKQTKLMWRLKPKVLLNGCHPRWGRMILDRVNPAANLSSDSTFRNEELLRSRSLDSCQIGFGFCITLVSAGHQVGSHCLHRLVNRPVLFCG